MTDYSFAQAVNGDALADTIGETSIAAKFVGLVSSGSTLTISMTSALDAGEEAILDAVLAAHDPAIPSVGQRVDVAKLFAGVLVDKWQKRIMLDGVLQAGQAYAVATALANSTIHASFGNLYALEVELGTITPIATFLDETRLTAIRNEIRAFLGMPLL